METDGNAKNEYGFIKKWKMKETDGDGFYFH